MSGLVGILDIGKRALMTYGLAMNITGHNVADTNTPGFSRQRPILTTTLPIDFRPSQLGTGAKVDEIQRMRDQLLNLQVRGRRARWGNGGRGKSSWGRWRPSSASLQIAA